MDISALNVFDAVVLSLIFVSTVFAFVRGFIRTVFSLLCWTLSIVCTIFLAPYAIRYLEGSIESLWAVLLIAYIGGFMLVFMLFAIIFSFIVKIARPCCDGFVDRSLGAGLGLFRGTLIACLVFLTLLSSLSIVTDNQDNPDYKGPSWLAEAQSYNFLRLASSLFVEIVPDEMRESMAQRFRHIGNLASAVVSEGGTAGTAPVPELNAEHQNTLDRIITVLPEDSIDRIDAQYGNVTRKMLSPEERLDLHARIIVAYEDALAKGAIISDDRIPPEAVASLKAEILSRMDALRKSKEQGAEGGEDGAEGKTEGQKPAAYNTEKLKMMQRLVDQFQ